MKTKKILNSQYLQDELQNNDIDKFKPKLVVPLEKSAKMAMNCNLISSSSKNKHEGSTHRTRFNVALLGLAIAAANCYAQATFCIAIVEMVLPADFVFRNDSTILKVETKLTGLATTKLNVTQALNLNYSDKSCPLEHRYRDYYDSWRFPTSTNEQNNTSSELITPASHKGIDMSNRFDWDASRQGLLLGAFAIGTAPLQVIAGRLAELYGAKWVLLAGCVGSALTNLTIPFLAHFSFILLILNRVLMGIAQAGMEPGLMCLLAKWLTPAETGFYISMLLFAICIGFFLGSLCSSFLLTLGYGWEITYYVTAIINLIVSLAWLLYASSTPEESTIISKQELEYIRNEQNVNDTKTTQLNNDLTRSILKIEDYKQEKDLNFSGNSSSVKENILMQQEDLQSKEANNNIQAPWMNIIGTRSVWAFIICKISIRWSADVLSIELPTYLANVLHLSIKLNGILNSVSSALFAIFSFLTGYFVNEILIYQQKLIKEKNETGQLKGGKSYLLISKTNLRKIFQSSASFGAAISIFLMTRYDCNIVFSMSMMLVLSSCLVMGTGGELQIPYDMTPKYPGTLHGMACTLSVSGWLAPPLIGLILADQPSSRYRWSLVWYLTGLINLVGGLVFVLFADASPRNFDQRNPREEKKLENYDQKKGNFPPSGCDDNLDRGRHLVSYFNMACKSENLPPKLEHNANTTLREANDGFQSKSFDSNWIPFFDRELIKIRQVEDSYIMRPSYFGNGCESVTTSQTIIFPYCSKGQQEIQMETSSLAADGEHRSLWRLWPRFVRRQKKFHFDENKRTTSVTRTTFEQSSLVSSTTASSSSSAISLSSSADMKLGEDISAQSSLAHQCRRKIRWLGMKNKKATPRDGNQQLVPPTTMAAPKKTITHL